MPIEASPVFRFVVNTTEGTRATNRILLRRSDGEPLVVRRTKVPLSGVVVTAQPVDQGADQTPGETPATPTPWGAAHARSVGDHAGPGDVWLEMETDPALPAGRYSDTVHVATNDPEAPEIEIPFTIRVRPLIDARPGVVRMWTASSNDASARSAIVTLQHHGNRKFTIKSVEISHPEIFTAVPYGEEPSSRQTVRIGLVEGLDADALGSSLEGWIRVTTDDPEKPVIEVPVLVAPNRSLSRRPVDGIR
jgi:hypothetical protein